MSPRRKKILRVLGVVLGTLLLGLLVAYFALDEPRPRGRTGAGAETMADAMLEAVRHDAWERTGAVAWTFAGITTHLWDRRRDYDRVRKGDTEVLLRIDNRSGIAKEHGRVVHGARARELVDEAYAAWANDSFWLNPIAKVRDPGVSREVVRGDDHVARLLVAYSEGGVTPGDAYLWTPGESGAPPTEWRMWVHVFAVGGVRATWERWITLRTGARVSTLHHIGPLPLELTGVDGRETLHELGGGEDPFAPLVRENQRNAEHAQREGDAVLGRRR